MLSHQSLSLRTLVRALEFSDGPEQLAAQLLLSESDLKSMLDSVSPVPEEIFLQAVDFLIDRGLIEHHLAAARSHEFKPEARALANALANLPVSTRIAQSSFKWLPMDAFGRLTQEQKVTYLTEIIKQLGLHP